jgi:RNA polymerase sigma-70 factor (ECF subfamily)
MVPAVRSDHVSPPAGASCDLDAIYRVHAADVARWIAYLGGPGLDAEDLVHEVFLVVQRRLSEFRGDAKVTTWLYQITQRVVQAARRRERFRRWVRRVRRRDVADALSPSATPPGAALEREQAARIVYAVLDRLPEKYRTPLILFEIEGMSGEAIAALLGVRTETLWVQIHRARALFLNVLKESES